MFSFTIRDLLWVTVVAAVLLGWWADRSLALISRASYHESQCEACFATYSGKSGLCVNANEAAWCLAMSEWHRKASEANRLALWRPWLRFSEPLRPLPEHFNLND
jgi:hypothetical protein